jgi:hypothetical protein
VYTKDLKPKKLLPVMIWVIWWRKWFAISFDSLHW